MSEFTNYSPNVTRKKVADMIGLLNRKKRKVSELELLTGMAPATIRAWLNVLQNENVVCEIPGNYFEWVKHENL